MRKHILLISTGGTISQEQGVFDTATATSNKDAQLFTSMLKRLDGIDIEPRVLFNKDSSNITVGDWTTLIDTIVDAYDDYDAFVVTHGTNTLGYTSAALSFALGNLGKRVILTGSQVPFGTPGSDALTNLENAIQIAAHDRELYGVMVVFGSHIITGVRVKKTTEFEYDAFKTFGGVSGLGRIGRKLIWNDEIIKHYAGLVLQPAKRRMDLDIVNTFDMALSCLTEYTGMPADDLILPVKHGGKKGIILRSTGAGDPNVGPRECTYPDLRLGFEFLRDERIPIVVTTQAPDGIATMDVNDPGMFARELGAIPALDMSIEAMTVKLGWLLGQGSPYELIRSRMRQSIRGEVAHVR